MLHTPVTSASNDLAICTENVPTPPDAPTISTLCPVCTCALRTACSAVPPEIGAVAACSNGTAAGLAASFDDSTRAYSLNAPSQVPYTASPMSNPVTFVPTDSTVPASARPGMVVSGDRTPKPARSVETSTVADLHADGAPNRVLKRHLFANTQSIYRKLQFVDSVYIGVFITLLRERDWRRTAINGSPMTYLVGRESVLVWRVWR